MTVPSPSGVESKLLQQLAETDLKLAELMAEKRALERLIAKVRRENFASAESIRKNSFDRILVEKVILAALSRAAGPVKTKALFAEALATHHGLKDNTFRSYLHRMKERGLIAPDIHTGCWVLPTKRSSATAA
jgi:hypothetical protein